MTRHPLLDSRRFSRAFDRLVIHLPEHVMTPLNAALRSCPRVVLGSRIHRSMLRRKQPKPFKVLRRLAELPCQGSRHVHPGQPCLAIFLPYLPRQLDLLGDLPAQTLWQHRHPILVALALAHRQRPAPHIHILHPQPHQLR